MLAYAAASKGFRVGGVQPGLTTPLSQNQAPVKFESDTIWNYEGGFRSEWLGGTLRADVTGFHEVWKKPQTLQADASGVAVFIGNVGGAKSTGADAALQYLTPLPGLRVDTSATYADTVTTEPFTTTTGRRIEVGSRWPLAPRWQTATTASYILSLGDWMLGAFATHTYLGETITDLALALPVYGYQLWDAQIRVANPALSWLPELSLTVNNLADERGVTNQFSSGLPTPERAEVEVYYTQPRTAMLRLTGRFGR